MRLLSIISVTCLAISSPAFAQEEEEEAEEDVVEQHEDVPELEPIVPGEVAEKSAGARKKELGQQPYRFCHDKNFGKDGTEGRDFCAIFDESSDEACPEARNSCPGWISEGQGKASGHGGAGTGGRSRIARRSSSTTLNLPRLPPIVGYLIIGALIALVLYWFIKSLKNAGWESEEKFTAGENVISEAERNLLVLPEARARVLLDLSTKALGRGEPKEAAILLHLAVLRHLDDEGLARWHASKTNGDYLRAIRPHKALAALFRSVANQTERIRFGDGQTEAEKIAPLIDDARRLLVKRAEAAPAEAAGGPVGAATMLALCALALGAEACGDRPDPAFFAKGPTGMAALMPVLRESGLRVEVSRARLQSLPPDTGVVVLRTSAGDDSWPATLKLDKTLDRDISVVVIDDLWRSRFFLPLTATAAFDRGAIVAELEKPAQSSLCTWKLAELDPLAAEGKEAVRLPSGRRLVPNGTSTSAVSSKELELAPLLTYRGERTLRDGRRAAIAWAADRRAHSTSLAGCLYVFSDRDLFTNASLTREPNARFVSAFFAALVADGRRIVFLDRFDPWIATESGDEEDKAEPTNPAKPLESSNMLPFIAQAMLALIALYLAIGAAFGPLRDPAVREHKAFIEHVEAIGRQYARTGIMGLTHSARALARLVVMRNRDQVRGGTGGGWSGVAGHLAQKLDLEEKDVRAALRLGIDGVSELGTPAIDDPSPSSERMLRTLSRLLGGRESPTQVKRKRKPLDLLQKKAKNDKEPGPGPGG